MGFRSFKHSGRRAFLRNLGGAAVALPLLEFTHGKAWAADETTLRFLTVFSHGGTISNQARSSSDGMGLAARHDGMGNIYGSGSHGIDWWRPASADESLMLGPIHEGLEPWREKLLVLEGIDNKTAIVADPYSHGGHGISNVTALAPFTPSGEGDDSIGGGPSIDQVVAERLAARQEVKFDRIHLNISGHQYGSPYFRAAGERVSGMNDPTQAFNTLFEGVSPDPEADPEFIRQRIRRTSMVEGLLYEYGRYKDVVSARDKHVIEAHLDHLRSLEKELASSVVCAPPGESGLDDGASGELRGPVFAEMIVAALRCGLTNVANLEIADILTPWTEAGLQVESAFDIGHSLGHIGRDIGSEGATPHLHDPWMAEVLDNRRWRMSLVAQILEGLDDPAFLEGDNTLLDNSLLLYTSEFREPAKHVAANVPVLLAGSAGGALNTGRFIDYNAFADQGHDTLHYDSPMSLHNLFTSILQAMGEQDSHFGNEDNEHEGPLPDLT